MDHRDVPVAEVIETMGVNRSYPLADKKAKEFLVPPSSLLFILCLGKLNKNNEVVKLLPFKPQSFPNPASGLRLKIAGAFEKHLDIVGGSEIRKEGKPAETEPTLHLLLPHDEVVQVTPGVPILPEGWGRGG
jgi:hypothetical protein